MDLMKELYGSAESTVEPKSVPKADPKADPKAVATVEPKHVSMIESNHVPKSEPKTMAKPASKAVSKAQPIDNEKLRRLEHELDQAECDYTYSIGPLMAAKQQYFLLKNGYDQDPENSSKEAVLEASATLADCQSRQDAIDRRRKSLKKQIAELKGGANSQ